MNNVLINTTLLIVSIILGGLSGVFVPQVAMLTDFTDYLILALVCLVFYEVPLTGIKNAIKAPKVLAIAWLTNFLVLPLLGFALTKLFLADHPMVAIGVAIYFMSPCTDWFLGFTRIAKGNIALGSVLLPINLATQFILYPIWLQLFTYESVSPISAQEITTTLVDWFLVPAAIAVALKVFSHYVKPLVAVLSNATNIVLFALVFLIFAGNFDSILSSLNIFGVVFGVVVLFFAISFALTEGVSKVAAIDHQDHVLYTMTTIARNAPLMLGLTTAAIPDQPLVYATIIIGMLIEFPYLASHVWRFTRKPSIAEEKITKKTN